MATPERDAIRPPDGSTVSPPIPEAPGFEHFRVNTPDLQSHVAIIGEGEPVVMLHGFPQHCWQWRDIAPALTTAGYQVVCPDLRGAGWTVAANSQLDRETRLHDVLHLLDVLEIKRAHPAFQHLPRFIWHRSGTSLAATFAGRYVVHPMSDETIATYLAPMQRPAIDAAVRPLTRRMIMPEALRIVRGVYRNQHLKVPTLVVYGRQDAPTTEELMQQICRDPERYADHVEFSYVDDAAHFITDDAPDAVSELCLDWFQRAG